MKVAQNKESVLDSVRLYFWGKVLGLLSFVGKTLYRPKEELIKEPESKLGAGLLSKENESQELANEVARLEASLSVVGVSNLDLIKAIREHEKTLQKKDASNPLIVYAGLIVHAGLEDSPEWIQARMLRIQGYCTVIPFDERNPLHTRVAMLRYMLALKQQLGLSQEIS